MLHSEHGKVREAATCFEQALALDPRHAAACLQFGDSLMDLHEYDRALAAYRHALTLRVPFPEAHNNLAGALLHLGDTHAAIAECRQALVERPGYVLALNTLGAALGKVGLLDEAIAVLRQAIDLSHAYANAHHNLGNVLDRAGRVEEAKQAYHAALTINPTLEEARYNLAALGDMPPPPSTPYPYLLRLFDSYAPSFDQHLVEALDYVVPEKLYEAVLAARPGAAALDVIDLGCGTGLVGQHFRRIAGRLTGIDISARMMQWAERRKIYDQLVLGDYVRLSERTPGAVRPGAGGRRIHLCRRPGCRLSGRCPVAASRRSIRLFPGSHLESRLRLAAESALCPFSRRISIDWPDKPVSTKWRSIQSS